MGTFPVHLETVKKKGEKRKEEVLTMGELPKNLRLRLEDSP
jgi:hypothetical protein